MGGSGHAAQLHEPGCDRKAAKLRRAGHHPRAAAPHADAAVTGDKRRVA